MPHKKERLLPLALAFMPCLISLGKEQTISKINQLIKGESYFWINKNNICRGHFMWQDDYFAVSVSESQISFDTVVKA